MQSAQWFTKHWSCTMTSHLKPSRGSSTPTQQATLHRRKFIKLSPFSQSCPSLDVSGYPFSSFQHSGGLPDDLEGSIYWTIGEFAEEASVADPRWYVDRDFDLVRNQPRVKREE